MTAATTAAHGSGARGAAPLAAGVERDLRGILGPDGLITEPDALLVYETDALPAHRELPRAVLLPRTTEAVVACVRTLAAEGIPFAPRGAGTGLSGGAISPQGGVVLSLARMNRILSLDPANRVARVEAGCVNARLNAAARPHGLRYAPDPSSEPVCTIGGNVAENSGGPHCLKYGVTMNHVLGVTVVLSDGSIVRLGGAAREQEGVDLLGLFVGSEGTFGVATEIEVRLTPLPESVETLLALFDDVNDASRAVSAIIAAGLLPAALEMVDRQGILAVEGSNFSAGMPTDIEGALVIEFDGPAAGPAEDAESARAICLEHRAREVRRATSEAERARLWHARKKAYGAMGRLAPDLLVQDATVPRSRLPETMARIYEIARRHGLRVSNTFHAGDGNLHPKILFDRREPHAVETVARASKEMMQACVEAGGTITGEHGVGLDKRDYMGLIYGPAELDAMRAVRAVFDPRGLVNPGKVLPAGNGSGGAPGARPPGIAESGRRRRPAADALETLRAELGHEAVRSPEDPAFRVHGVAPAAVVAPVDEGQAAAALRLCADHGWRARPAGAGTWLRSGPEARADVVLTTERMRGILEYEPADLMAGVAAGTPLAELDAALRPHGQFFPVQPPAAFGATVGATIATGSAGPLRLGFGTPRDHVLGVRVVTGDGRVLDLGGRVVKNVAGYDLVRLFVGSEGTLGLITRAFLRLKPTPARDITAIFRADTPEPLVQRALALGDGWPVAAELLDGGTAAALLDGSERWALAMRWHGNESFAGHLLARLAAFAPASPAVLTADRAEALWGGLASVEAEAAACFRLTALPERLSDLLRAGIQLGGSSSNAQSDKGLHDPLGLRWRIVAHARSGMLRLWTDAAAEGRTDALLQSYLSVRKQIGAWGSVRAEVLPPSLVPAAAGPGGPVHTTAEGESGTLLDGAASPEAGLRNGIRRTLDPFGVLAGTRAPLGEEAG